MRWEPLSWVFFRSICHRKSHELACTSDCYKLYILRCTAQLHLWENSLQKFVEPFDLESYGYYKINNTFHLLLMTQPATPALLVQPCKCKNCSKNTCGCSTNKSTCCSYCKCASTCKNPYKHERTDEESEDEGGK